MQHTDNNCFLYVLLLLHCVSQENNVPFYCIYSTLALLFTFQHEVLMFMTHICKEIWKYTAKRVNRQQSTFTTGANCHFSPNPQHLHLDLWVSIDPRVTR